MFMLLSQWRLFLAGAGIVAFVGLLGGVYFKGYQAARDACQSQALQEKINRLESRIEVARKVQEAAVKRAEERMQEADELQEKVDAYENELENSGDCILSGADIERLSAIR